MSQPHLPFALPDIGEEEIAEVVDSLRSGWVTTGPKTRRFEQEFGAFLGGGVHAVAVNSATGGLHLALEAAGVGPDDEVVTTPLTFTATAAAARFLGAHPVLADVDPASYCIDAQRLREAITPRTRAIIPVHYGGLSCDMTEILRVAGEHGVRVIEDAAHALPATHDGKLIGTLGSDATVFSFYATKTITTGEGGMVVTRDPSLAERCRVMRLHGIDRDAFDRYTSDKPTWYYEVVAPGFKYNMTDIAAALGLQQLRKAWAFQHRRQQIAACYDQAFAGLPVVLPPRPSGGDTHSWHLYALRLLPEAGVERGQFIQRMAEAGIGCSVHFMPLYRHPYWRETYALDAARFPCTEQIWQSTVSLPIYTRMTDAQMARVAEAVVRLLT